MKSFERYIIVRFFSCTLFLKIAIDINCCQASFAMAFLMVAIVVSCRSDWC